ncbi:hypothetical protein RJP56_18930 [Shewanella baltica]|uniref:hypothetical protein n=1 Tax=Shewanella baltica TaxID=62322 RepID=UPI002871ACB1|nr:hypothetical protein [Shewanella baltica]MDR9768139.1 hypothetical protein [Shewanella baltica]
MQLTAYAQSLVNYCMGNGFKTEVAATAFLDSCLEPLWYMMHEQPPINDVVISQGGDDDE